MYYQEEANARDNEVEELIAPEYQVPFGLAGIGQRLPIYLRATKRAFVDYNCLK